MKPDQMRVLLTGASGGIGHAIANRLLEAGAAVLAHGRSESRLRACFGSTASIVTGDLCCGEDVERIREAAVGFGVNVLINNAGHGEFGRFETSDVEAVMTTNVIGPLRLTQALLPALRQQPAAIVANVGSTFGAIGFPGYVTYAASKHAIRGFSESLRRELSDTTVDVIYISPRATRTSMNTPAACKVNEELGVESDTPDFVAAEVVKALCSRRARVQLGSKERMQVRLNALVPSLVDTAIERQLPTIRQFVGP